MSNTIYYQILVFLNNYVFLGKIWTPPPPLWPSSKAEDYDKFESHLSKMTKVTALNKQIVF